MDQAQRFVFSGPGPVEEAIRWGVEHRFTRIDFNADSPPNYPGTFTPERVVLIRDLCARHGVTLGIHTLSAVNMAEITPVMNAAADEYLRQNFDLAAQLGASYVICHGGFHFGDDREARFQVAIDRMRRATEWAEARGIDIYFENHNKEPDEAEIHYLPRDVAETRRFFDAIRLAALQMGLQCWSRAPCARWLRWLPRRLRRRADRPGAPQRHPRPLRGAPAPGRGHRRLPPRLPPPDRAGLRRPFTLDFGNSEVRAEWRDRFAELLGT